MLDNAHLQEDNFTMVNVLSKARAKEAPCENLVSTQVRNTASNHQCALR